MRNSLHYFHLVFHFLVEDTVFHELALVELFGSIWHTSVPICHLVHDRKCAFADLTDAVVPFATTKFPRMSIGGWRIKWLSLGAVPIIFEWGRKEVHLSLVSNELAVRQAREITHRAAWSGTYSTVQVKLFALLPEVFPEILLVFELKRSFPMRHSHDEFHVLRILVHENLDVCAAL